MNKPLVDNFIEALRKCTVDKTGKQPQLVNKEGQNVTAEMGLRLGGMCKKDGTLQDGFINSFKDHKLNRTDMSKIQIAFKEGERNPDLTINKNSFYNFKKSYDNALQKEHWEVPQMWKPRWKKAQPKKEEKPMEEKPKFKLGR